MKHPDHRLILVSTDVIDSKWISSVSRQAALSYGMISWLDDLEGKAMRLLEEWGLDLIAPFERGSCSSTLSVRRVGGYQAEVNKEDLAVLKLFFVEEDMITQLALLEATHPASPEVYKHSISQAAILMEHCSGVTPERGAVSMSSLRDALDLFHQASVEREVLIEIDNVISVITQSSSPQARAFQREWLPEIVNLKE